ncbi:hypothetical protein C5167_013178 [Papaver somniferum]|uniref:DUF223 domain-containing protein n=1 Tax=Papaver somniferum TaxID=3469 RepID=A0A4Y7J3I4_PAPSO|nr:hypothetical protein C5167_013178 [Papaver somniferum]
MSTNDVSGVDMVIVDEQGEELHAVIPKNLIWKFDKLIREGGLYLMQKLHLTLLKRSSVLRTMRSGPSSGPPPPSLLWMPIPCTLFPRNSHSLNVVGFLKTVTNIQVLQRSDGQSSRMREITIENLR